MTLFRAFFISLALLAPAAITPTAFADSPPIYTPLRHDIALNGYDTISYFSGKPLKGQDRFSTEYKGAEWRFSSQANLDLFKTNPEVFIPQYGGYCAWAIAHGKLAKGSPKHWLVEDGRLYLNFNGRIQKRWRADQEQLVRKADARWPDILRD